MAIGYVVIGVLIIGALLGAVILGSVVFIYLRDQTLGRSGPIMMLGGIILLGVIGVAVL